MSKNNASRSSGRTNFKTKKQHRAAAETYAKADGDHWIRRICREMKDSPRVVDYVLKSKKDI